MFVFFVVIRRLNSCGEETEAPGEPGEGQDGDGEHAKGELHP